MKLLNSGKNQLRLPPKKELLRLPPGKKNPREGWKSWASGKKP